MHPRLFVGACCAILIVGSTLAARAQPAPTIDPALARQYFGEAQRLCERDGGRLWGETLCGPVIFASPDTLEVVASEPDLEGRLREDGGVWVGQMDPDMTPANTAEDWAGKRWTELVWPLPEDSVTRHTLLMHESWHRIQQDLGFASPMVVAEHLDSFDGRVWLILEWRALQAALAEPKPAQAEGVRDALLFRRTRFAAISDEARGKEIALEMSEGLAEYTGRHLCGLADDEHAAMLIDHLERGLALPSYTRTFPYHSTPAWGFLLDLEGVAWREGLQPDTDIAELFARKTGLEEPDPSELEHLALERAEVYGYAELAREETAREEQRLARLERQRRLLVREPHVRLPLTGGRYNLSFDPRRLTPLDDLGSVMGKLRVTSEWGQLEVDGAPALLSEDWTEVCVPWPEERAGERLGGEGWTLQLAPGWRAKLDEEGVNLILASE
jgi:hypothetical protein